MTWKDTCVMAAVAIFILGIAGWIALLAAWPFMWGWNFAVVQAVSVAQPITYWPAFVLMWFMGFLIAARRSNSSIEKAKETQELPSTKELIEFIRQIQELSNSQNANQGDTT